jgi:hypothetical protein
VATCRHIVATLADREPAAAPFYSDSAGSQGNQALQRGPEIPLALLMCCSMRTAIFGLLLLQLACFLVVFVLRNPPLALSTCLAHPEVAPAWLGRILAAENAAGVNTDLAIYVRNADTVRLIRADHPSAPPFRRASPQETDSGSPEPFAFLVAVRGAGSLGSTDRRATA